MPLLSPRTGRLAAIAALVCTVAAGGAARASAAAAVPTVELTDTVVHAIDGQQEIATTDRDVDLSIGIVVRGRDEAGRNALAARLLRTDADTSATVTPAEFAQRFGVEAPRATALRSWLQRGGLSVDYQGPSSTYVLARGPIASIESLLGVTIGTYARPDGTTFHANEQAAQVPASLGISTITGLDDQARLHTTLSVQAQSALPTSSTIQNTTTAPELWSIYGMPMTNRGVGQRLSAIGWGVSDGVFEDLRAQEARYNLPATPFSVVHVGPTGTETDGKGEWDLDSQASTGMAPDVNAMTFYFGTSGALTDTGAATQVWNDDPQGGLQASSSFGTCEAFGAGGDFLNDNRAYDSILQQSVLEGRSMFVSTGDNGAFCRGAQNGVPGGVPGVEFPASSPYVVAVGGTVLYATGTSPNLTRSREDGWSAGGGGQSSFEPRPAYQSALTVLTRSCPTDYDGDPQVTVGCRGVPDIAAQSGDLVSGFHTTIDGVDQGVLGTSLSAPLWNGMWTRINAAAPKVGNAYPGLGFANPRIYASNADAVAYAADFYDVITGDNGLPATPSWDFVTGWGTPNITALMTKLSGGTVPTNPGGAGDGSTPVVTTVPPVVLPPCSTLRAQVVDVEGDASLDPPAPSNPSVDLRSANVDALPSSDGGTLRSVIKVTDLGTSPPAGYDGEHFENSFSFDGNAYILQATRLTADPNADPAGGQVAMVQRFELARPGAANSFPTVIATGTGSFDATADAITILLPVSRFNTASGATPGHALASGSALSGFGATGQLDEGAGRLTLDTATAQPACTSTLRFASAQAVVPEAPYAALLPATAVGLVAAAWAVLRRRRTA